MATDNDALKVLVDDALARGVHADHERVLTEWRKDNTTDEERRAALTDDERTAEDAKRAENERTAEDAKRAAEDAKSGEENGEKERPPTRSGSRSR
jgi:hypothetical protein